MHAYISLLMLDAYAVIAAQQREPGGDRLMELLSQLRRAGEIKALWRRVSLADCIALALAEQRGGELLTTDHHELDLLFAAAYPIRFLR